MPKEYPVLFDCKLEKYLQNATPFYRQDRIKNHINPWLTAHITT